MIEPLPTAPGGFNRVLVAIDKFTKWIEVKPVTCPKADRVLDFLHELVHRYGLPLRIITDLGSNFNNHQFWEYCENSGIDVRYVSVVILGLTDKSSTPTGWCSMLSRSGYMTLLTLKEASGSKNYPMHSGGYVLNPPSKRGNPITSWSTAPKQSSLLMSYGIHQQWNTTTKASLKTADELTSTGSKKLAAPPSSNQQGTWRVSDATMIATSRNAPSTLVISSSAASRTQKDYTSSAPPWEGPFTVAKVTGSGSYRLQTLEGEDVNNSWSVEQLCRFNA
jgi:hypothetical protein